MISWEARIHLLTANMDSGLDVLQKRQYIFHKIDDKEFNVGLAFDLTSAFDTILIDFVSDKLNALGIRVYLNDWVIWFLRE